MTDELRPLPPAALQRQRQHRGPRQPGQTRWHRAREIHPPTEGLAKAIGFDYQEGHRTGRSRASRRQNQKQGQIMASNPNMEREHARFFHGFMKFGTYVTGAVVVLLAVMAATLL